MLQFELMPSQQPRLLSLLLDIKNTGAPSGGSMVRFNPPCHDSSHQCRTRAMAASHIQVTKPSSNRAIEATSRHDCARVDCVSPRPVLPRPARDIQVLTPHSTWTHCQAQDSLSTPPTRCTVHVQQAVACHLRQVRLHSNRLAGRHRAVCTAPLVRR